MVRELEPWKAERFQGERETEGTSLGKLPRGKRREHGGMGFSSRAIISEKRVQRSQTQVIGGRETQPRWEGTCCSGQP